MCPLDVREGWEDLPLVLDRLMFMVGLSGLPCRGERERKVSHIILAHRVQDREADIFEFLVHPRRKNTHLLIRAAQPRLVEIAGEPSTLFDAAARAPVVGTRLVKVGAKSKPGQALEQREALLTLRLACVQVCRGRQSTPVWLVRASEEGAPLGVEPIEWVLLCTQEVSTAAQAQEMVAYYALRWRVERFHFVLKSGLGFEKVQIDSGEALKKLLCVYSIVAWRLLYLLYLSLQESPRSSSEVFDRMSLLVLEQAQLDRAVGPLGASGAVVVGELSGAVSAIAVLGGFRGSPSAPLPGVKSLWLGLRRLEGMVEGFHLAFKMMRHKGQD